MQTFRAALVVCILCAMISGASGYGQTRARRKSTRPAAANRELSPSDQIDRLVEARVRKLAIPGYSLAVISKDVVILQKGYGFSDTKSEQPVTPNTVFGLASITKTFTALALLMLVDDGKVKLDSPLKDYLPGLSPSWRKLTLRQLASMTAGVPKCASPALSWPEEMRKLEEEPLASPAGTQFLYSNCSYRVIGSVIERVTGQTYVEFLRSRVLGPLGMLDTGPTDRSFEPPIATPYGRNADGQSVPLPGYKDTAINFSAGMLASNTIDLARYARALAAHRLISPKSFDLLWKTRPELASREKPDWAFGWASQVIGGHLRVSMNGDLPGVASTIIIFPDDKLIVIGLANIGGPAAHELTRSVASVALGGDAGVIDEAGTESF